MTNIMDSPKLIDHYSNASARLILLDFDGTLPPLDLPPSSMSQSLNIKSTLRKMASDPKNHVVLISSRNKENLETHWGDLNIILAAEYGGFFKNPKGNWTKIFSYSNSWAWLQKAVSAMHALSFQYEGSVVEQKSFSVAWHYSAVGERVEQDKQQILAAIRALPLQEDFLICDSQYTIELRPRGINKGSSVSRWVGNQNYDFVMAIAGSKTDEDLFQIFGKREYTIKVGSHRDTAANYYLDTQDHVLPFIERLLIDNREVAWKELLSSQNQ